MFLNLRRDVVGSIQGLRSMFGDLKREFFSVSFCMCGDRRSSGERLGEFIGT